jgi:hypothetical protein
MTTKQSAEEAAHRVRGVKAVANDIEVRLSTFGERTDAEIAAAAARVPWNGTRCWCRRSSTSPSPGAESR